MQVATFVDGENWEVIGERPLVQKGALEMSGLPDLDVREESSG